MCGIELVEGKDWPAKLSQQEYGNLGATLGLLLRLLVPIFHLGLLLSLTAAFVC